ncbi:MAG: RidA family protein [Burkholderiales bacterium]
MKPTLFSRIDPPGGWPDNITFSAAVRVGDQLFISGMTALGPDGLIVAPGDIGAQARYIYLEKLLPVLRAAGGGFEHVVETVDYVTTFDGYKDTAAVRREIFGGPPFPAATGVMVSGLVRKNALIEIRATAVLPARASTGS